MEWKPLREYAVPAAAVAGAASLAWTAGLLLTGNTYARGDGVATGWAFVETAALLVLTLLTVRVGTPRSATVAAGLSGLAVPLWLLRFGWGPLTASTLGGYAAWGLLPLLAVSVGLYLRALDERRRRSVAEARRAQRVQLARDLHDYVAHDISGMLAQAQAGQILAERDPSGTGPAFQRIEQSGWKALTSMDRAVHMLHDVSAGADDRAASPPTVRDLPDVVSRFAAVGPAHVHLDLDPYLADDETLPREVTTTAYRIVVEALTNVRRHAPAATQVSASICHTTATPGVEIAVTDDGPPAVSAPAERRGGLGLPGLTERVEALGGTLTAGPADPTGWRVAAFLPLESLGGDTLG